MTNDIQRLLSVLGYGEDKAMTRGALCALLGLPDRAVRKLIEEARREETEDGPFIVTADKGYFLAADADEIERHYRGEYSRAMAILVRTKGERKFLKKAGRL